VPQYLTAVCQLGNITRCHNKTYIQRAFEENKRTKEVEKKNIWSWHKPMNLNDRKWWSSAKRTKCDSLASQRTVLSNFGYKPRRMFRQTLQLPSAGIICTDSFRQWACSLCRSSSQLHRIQRPAHSLPYTTLHSFNFKVPRTVIRRVAVPLSVRPSTWNRSRKAERIFMEFETGELYWNLSTYSSSS
jgi:hypothetical protein